MTAERVKAKRVVAARISRCVVLGATHFLATLASGVNQLGIYEALSELIECTDHVAMIYE